MSEIDIHNYVFNFPGSYKKIESETFNSYSGKISNDTVNVKFHYSNHVQPPAISVAQFLHEREWEASVLLYIATSRHYFGKVTYSVPRKATEKDSSVGSGCDYIVKCKSDSLELEAPIYLPYHVKGITISIDTVLGQYRETYIADDPGQGITGVFIKPLHQNSKEVEPDALSLTTTHLTRSQQKEVLRIFSSFRLHKTD